MNWQTEHGEDQLLQGLIEPLLSNRTATTPGGPAGDWLCAWCLHRVANDQDRFQFEGKDQFEFTNPAGVRFEIITFGQTLGCRPSGTPTLEHTWFPGYAWSFCQCEQCGQHLGWYYSGVQEFVGLIKNRILRALHVRN